MCSWHLWAVKVIRLATHALCSNEDLYEILRQPGWFTSFELFIGWFREPRLEYPPIP